MSERINRGDVYWIEPLGAVELASGERAVSLEHAHPHVVVSENVFNHSRITTVVVCALTTNLQRGNEPGNVLLDDGEPVQNVPASFRNEGQKVTDIRATGDGHWRIVIKKAKG